MNNTNLAMRSQLSPLSQAHREWSPITRFSPLLIINMSVSAAFATMKTFTLVCKTFSGVHRAGQGSSGISGLRRCSLLQPVLSDVANAMDLKRFFTLLRNRTGHSISSLGELSSRDDRWQYLAPDPLTTSV